MKNLKAAIRLVTIMFPLCFTLHSYSQNNKSVNEPCDADSNCRSGNCVTLRDGSKLCSSCTQRESDDETAEVDKYCKNKQDGVLAYSDIIREFNEDYETEFSIIELNERLAACKACRDARIHREDKCWNGGDPGHIGEINKMKDAVSYLEKVIDIKKSRKIAYYCDKDTYNDIKDDIADNCHDIDDLYKKYITDNPTDVSCNDIFNLIDKCGDCREAYGHMLSDCFKDGFAEYMSRRFEKIKDMEKVSKETYDKRKNENTCK